MCVRLSRAISVNLVPSYTTCGVLLNARADRVDTCYLIINHFSESFILFSCIIYVLPVTNLLRNLKHRRANFRFNSVTFSSLVNNITTRLILNCVNSSVALYETQFDHHIIIVINRF